MNPAQQNLNLAQQNVLCISRLRTALPLQQTAPRKTTGPKKYDTRSTVQQRDNRIGKKKKPGQGRAFLTNIFSVSSFRKLGDLVRQA
ncbi:hypothetical protein JQ620_22195 [Bradyrhizobium sp. AUGA SZCCT0274]|uniref:hypothetical protein n=1 Tax=Bradyrhizobium sp. AUGA SZCCT0274 TaxID=2807670 RepID=UPI001BA6F649|nr:hypothetical protein [Bradyrhizobium sp. AUGA SZCCT0274]MBR1242823.1 hypothetical protein [Bradyrhizobium sp. AUGA SZCCT0274]